MLHGKEGHRMNPATQTSMTRTREAWSHLPEWLDALVPSDLSWRTGFPHSMRVEEFNRNGAFVIRAELPGIDPEKDVDITVKDRLLTIAGKREEQEETAQRSEFYYGRFMRTLTLPVGASGDEIHATYRDGILEVEIPMHEPAEQVQRISVTRAP
jgi:HSP20 family protein